MTAVHDTKCLSRPGKMQRKTILASLNCDGPMGLALLACLALPGMLHLGGPAVTAALRFDRAAIGH